VLEPEDSKVRQVVFPRGCDWELENFKLEIPKLQDERAPFHPGFVKRFDSAKPKFSL